MKVFICWSGEPSKSIAERLSEWLQTVVPGAEPFVSSEDIRSGARWFVEISHQLEHADFAILCLTPGNTTAPWIHFEAGAVSKRVQQSQVCPLLFQGLAATQIETPLSAFQARVFSEEGLRQLQNDINKRLGTPHEQKRIDDYFEKFWTELATDIKELLEAHPATEEQVKRPPEKILEELVDLARGLGRRYVGIERVLGLLVDRIEVTDVRTTRRHEELRQDLRSLGVSDSVDSPVLRWKLSAAGLDDNKREEYLRRYVFPSREGTFAEALELLRQEAPTLTSTTTPEPSTTTPMGDAEEEEDKGDQT